MTRIILNNYVHTVIEITCNLIIGKSSLSLLELLYLYYPSHCVFICKKINYCSYSDYNSKIIIICVIIMLTGRS